MRTPTATCSSPVYRKAAISPAVRTAALTPYALTVVPALACRLAFADAAFEQFISADVDVYNTTGGWCGKDAPLWCMPHVVNKRLGSF